MARHDIAGAGHEDAQREGQDGDSVDQRGDGKREGLGVGIGPDGDEEPGADHERRGGEAEKARDFNHTAPFCRDGGGHGQGHAQQQDRAERGDP